MITPELVKKLYSLLETKNIKKVADMIEALIGLLRNTENCSSSDVQIYLKKYAIKILQTLLKKYECLIYKMQNIVYAKMRDSVLNKHLETIKLITKSFIDSTTEDFKVCSDFAPFLAWSSQFIIYCR